MDYKIMYEQAIKRAKAMIQVAANQEELYNGVITIFPELKESEDEKIRKALIFHFQGDGYLCNKVGNIPNTDILAWLDKHGQTFTKKDVDDAYLKGVCDAKHELEKQGEQEHQYKSRPRYVGEEELLGANKQGEQILANIAKTCKDEKKPNPYSGTSFDYDGHTWGMCARDGGVEILLDGELKAFLSLEKSFIYPIHPQPELAPKSAMEAVKEEKVDNQNCVKPADKIEPKFHEGDIVKRKDNPHLTYILKRLTDDGDYEFHAIGKDGNEGCTCFVGVKYQDDWELVEQKTAWSEEDKEMLDLLIANYKFLCKEFRDKEHDFFVGMGLVEEDLEMVNWLKDLKDRVQPQPKQEWSEEDEKHIHSIISTIECCIKENEQSKVIADAYASDLEWFKSLMNRCKPSEDLPHWKKGTLKGKNVTGFNSDFFSHNGYYINYNELFDKLPKDE